MVSTVPLQRRRSEATGAAAVRTVVPEREERMDLSGGQGVLPITMHTASSPYGSHVLELHHDHANKNGQSRPQALPLPPAGVEDDSGKKHSAAMACAGISSGGGSPVKYRECLRNHAAAIGGNTTDGCGEFMPSGGDGSLEALKCSACGCHRNFHRKELDDFDGDSWTAHGHGLGHLAGRRLIGPAMPHHHKNIGSSGGLLVTADHYGAYAAALALPPPPPPQGHHQIIMALNMINRSESDEMDGSGPGVIMGDSSAARASGARSGSSSKKRFRTKFTPEQKACMREFAERVGWRLQKLDEAVVQQFCQEISVKRRVLNVWMHNNKQPCQEAAPSLAAPNDDAHAAVAARAVLPPQPKLPAAPQA